MKNLYKKVVFVVSIIIVLSVCILPLTGCNENKADEDSVFGLTPLSAETEKAVMDAVKACWGDDKPTIFDSMYYGTYNDCIVFNIIYSGNYYGKYIEGNMFEVSEGACKMRKDVIRFKGWDSFLNCLVYKDGEVYFLPCAYVRDMISIDDVNNIARYHNEYYDSDKWREEKKYCNLTVDDDFSNHLCVTMTNKASLKHKYDINDFKEIEFEKIELFDSRTDKLVREKLEAIRNSPNGVLEGDDIEKYAKVEEDCYHVSFRIWLKTTDKAEILDAVKKLEARDDVLEASPYSEDGDYDYRS